MVNQVPFDSNQEESKRDSTMAGFFDDNIRKMETGGSVAKKMSLRRPTKIVDGTILSRHKNVVSIV